MNSSDTGLIYFDEVRVPQRNLIGVEGQGFIYQMQQFQEERLWCAASCLQSLSNCVQWTVEWAQDRKLFGQKIDSYTALEGYIAARVLQEGLRRAGRNLTRDSFIEAIESLGKTKIADFPVSYGPKNHNGSSFVNLEMYTGDGSLVR